MSTTPTEKCCARAITCWACNGGKHHLCTGCHGCGCVISAQAAAHVHTIKTKKP